MNLSIKRDGRNQRDATTNRNIFGDTMKRIKSTLEDEQLLVDESANPADRASAAESLASDGLIDVVSPILNQ